MENLTQVQERIQEIINSDTSKDITNFKVMFNETCLFVTGECVDRGERYTFPAGTVGEFFIPTAKGYVSSEWKKSKFYKVSHDEVNEDFIQELLPFFQEEKSKTFYIPTPITAATAIANHITANGSDPYCTN